MLLLRQVSPRSFCKSLTQNPQMCFQDGYSLFYNKEIYLLVKEVKGIYLLVNSSSIFKEPGRIAALEGPKIGNVNGKVMTAFVWQGPSHRSCVCRVSQSRCPRGAPPPLGHSPQALRQSPTETSWSDELGTFQLSSSGWDPQQCCRLKKRKPTENKG